MSMFLSTEEKLKGQGCNCSPESCCDKKKSLYVYMYAKAQQ